MIDLHCHVLPGLDDGPPDDEGQPGARRCRSRRSGTRTIVATPHVSWDWPANDGETIRAAVGAVNAALRTSRHRRRGSRRRRGRALARRRPHAHAARGAAHRGRRVAARRVPADPGRGGAGARRREPGRAGPPDPAGAPGALPRLPARPRPARGARRRRRADVDHGDRLRRPIRAHRPALRLRAAGARARAQRRVRCPRRGPAPPALAAALQAAGLGEQAEHLANSVPQAILRDEPIRSPRRDRAASDGAGAFGARPRRRPAATPRRRRSCGAGPRGASRRC